MIKQVVVIIIITMLLSASMYAEAAEQNVIMEIQGMSCSL